MCTIAQCKRIIVSVLIFWALPVLTTQNVQMITFYIHQMGLLLKVLWKYSSSLIQLTCC